MKRLVLITIILSSLFGGQIAFAQQKQTARERMAQKKALEDQQKADLPELSVRAQIMNESQTQNIDNVPWMREIYRFVDLKKDKNAALYYPEMPIGKRMNLFTMMFKLLAKGEVAAYDFPIDNIEVFNDSTKIKFKDLLARFNIMYKEKDGKFIVDDSDIPSSQVQGYYLKEAWYFDPSNSTVDVKILAICPVILQQDDDGVSSQKYPMFWMPYENIRPYAARMPIMTSNLNNVSNQTVDDFFRKHSYDGEIFKTMNMRNLSLAQICGDDPVKLKKEQQKIEGELTQFNKDLWVYNDSIKALENSNVKPAKTKSSSNKSEKHEKTPKVSSSKSSSSPARSMRNRR